MEEAQGAGLLDASIRHLVDPTDVAPRNGFPGISRCAPFHYLDGVRNPTFPPFSPSPASKAEIPKLL
jgi:hypothetical protein